MGKPEPSLHRLIDIRKVLEIIGGSRSTLYRQIQRGHFPRPRKHPGGKKRFWFEDEVRKYVSETMQ
jgi:predicted DNA-binding transcriptional regulator AlpA